MSHASVNIYRSALLNPGERKQLKMVKVSSAFLFFVGIVILLLSVFGVIVNQYWLTVYVCVIGMILVIISALTNMIGSETDVIDSEGRAVLITGCDQGFGFELAQKFNSVGFKVFAGCLSPETNGALKLKQESAGRIYVFKLDVTSDESVKNSFNVVASLLKNHVLWCLINNAGIAEPSLVEFCPLESFHRHLDVNTMGSIRMSKTFLPLLRRSRGRIITIVSMAGRVAPWCLGAYNTSKYALIGFCDSLRREVAQFGVKVITIEPARFKCLFEPHSIQPVPHEKHGPMVADIPIEAYGPLDGKFRKKTNISDPNNAIDLNKQYWRQADDDLKAFYGEPFYKSVLKLYKRRHLLATVDLTSVVDDVMDAAVSYSPKIAYSSGPLKVRLSYWIMQFLPHWLQDSLVMSNAPDERVTANFEDT